MAERLQKIISQAGIASRRAAERLIVEGRVSVNGTTVVELGTKADPERDDIRVDGRRVKQPERHRYIVLNKPTGYMSTRSDPERRPTVMDLIKGVREYVYPVGRLDFDSEGLLLLTNDGELAAGLTHPSHEVARVYEVQVLGVPDAHELERLSKGVTIDGRRTEPAQVAVVSAPRGQRPSAARNSRARETSIVRVTVREGRNRQVRNMFDAVGHPVVTLRRVSIGPLKDSRLSPGHWRDLTVEEVQRLRKAATWTTKTGAKTGTTQGPKKPAAAKASPRATASPALRKAARKKPAR